MLLGWPDVEVVGITTAIDPGGIRAGFVHRVLELAGRTDVPVAAGFPAWGPDMDWNVQCDTNAAQVVFANATHLTLTTLAPTFKAHVRAEHLPRLRAAGPLGALLAHQAEAHAADNGLTDLGRT